MKTDDIKLQNLKGTIDFLPAQQKQRNMIIDKLKSVFELYGFLPLETSILCPFDLLASKYAGGAEILKEIYTLKDQGNRNIGLRYDLTVPFSKVVSANRSVLLPLRRFEIGKVFRDGPVKTGRMREFYQCDVDVCGISGQEIEVEFFLMTLECFKRLGLDVVIKWNNRKFLVGLLEMMGIKEEKASSVVLTLDKIEKINKDEIQKELALLGISQKQTSKLFEILSLDFEKIVQRIEIENANENLKSGLQEVQTILQTTKALGVENKCVFVPSLARGLEIYTGTVWEIFDASKSFASSLGGGGRYDKIITQFVDDGTEYPAVGMSFGLETIYALLQNKNVENNKKLCDVLVFAFEKDEEMMKVANKLRENNFSVVADYKNQKLKKSLAYADSAGIPFVIILGEDELKSNVWTLKNLPESEQITDTPERIIDYIKKSL